MIFHDNIVLQSPDTAHPPVENVMVIAAGETVPSEDKLRDNKLRDCFEFRTAFSVNSKSFERSTDSGRCIGDIPGDDRIGGINPPRGTVTKRSFCLLELSFVTVM
jgi:hypothetical protein